MPYLKNNRIALFGGAFDPPHKGHEKALQCFLEAVKPHRLYVIPSGRAPHKEISGGARNADRMELCQRAFLPYSPAVEVIPLELESEGITYTYLTVQEIGRRHPESELFLFVGTDQFLSFFSWKHPEEILARCTLCVMDRFDGSHEIRAKKEQWEQEFGARILLLQKKPYIISSTEIRNELNERGFSLSLSPAVNEYISRLGLYGGEKLERRFALICRLLEKVGEKRALHTLAVEREVFSLSRWMGVSDPGPLCLAALYHDLTKSCSVEEHLALCREENVAVTEEDLRCPAVLHGISAFALAKREGELTQEALLAIRYHTTGRENMSLAEKILFFADYIEETRSQEPCRTLRECFYRQMPRDLKERHRWLDTCIRKAMDDTLLYLKEKKQTFHPLTLQARESLFRKENQ